MSETKETVKTAERAESAVDSVEEIPTGREIPRKVIDTWVSIAVRVFERMVVKVEAPFFISVPQIISNLAFLISVCDHENTMGLRREFYSIEKESISTIQTRELVDDTLDFIRTWNSNLRNLTKPGHNLSIRRAICHPKYAKAYTFNTFKTLRRFEVELKIFEGFSEITTWVSKNLKAGDVQNTTSFLNIWPDATLGPQAPKGDNSTVAKKSRNVKHANTSKNQIETKINRQTFREMQKPPILVWASHVIVSIHPDIFEGSAIFDIENTECVQIHQSVKTKIELFHVETNSKVLLLPTTNNNLHLMIFYDYGRVQIGLERMKEIMSEYRNNAPCVIKPIISMNTAISRSKAGQNPFDTMSASIGTSTEMSIEESAIEQVFIPTWSTVDFQYSNLAEHFSACLDMSSIFYTGGFGDLAVPDAEPSASPNPQKIPHMQHFSLLSLVNSPHTSIKIDDNTDYSKAGNLKEKSMKKPKPKKSRPVRKTPITTIENPPKNSYEMIKMPFLVVLWDSSKDIPIYMGKICKNMKASRESEKISSGPCTIC